MILDQKASARPREADPANRPRQPISPVEVARAFTGAWTSHDLAAAARYVADDVRFDGPFQHTTGIQPYLDGLATFAQRVTGLNVLAAFGDDEHALIMYELTTDRFGVLTGAEHLVVRDGKIHADRVTFDTFPMRQGRGG